MARIDDDDRDVAEQVTDEAKDKGEGALSYVKDKAEDVVDITKRAINYSKKLNSDKNKYSEKMHGRNGQYASKIHDNSFNGNKFMDGAAKVDANEATGAVRKSNYAAKLHIGKPKAGADASTKTVSNAAKTLQRKQIKRATINAGKAAGKAAGTAVKEGTKVTAKVAAEGTKATATAVSASAKATTAAASSNPYTAIALLIVMAVILIIAGLLVWLIISCLATYTTAITSSFTAKDEDIIAVDNMYKAKEKALQNRLDNIPSEMPGYDEYRYNLDEIGHNPFELASILTVMYEAYTPTDPRVTDTLNVIFDKQYILTFEETVETRSRQRTGYYMVNGQVYSYTYTEYYDVMILTTTLKNRALSTVSRQMYLTEDQLKRYAVLIETSGNKPYLFEGDVNAIKKKDVIKYDIPPEFLTDEQFARMITEAEKYLGYPYVWGGSTPETSFDCSGFVSWVINHCGNGWDVGRSTANGLTGYTTPVRKEDAKPGDLIFFQGTYDTAGASHVGIYVGNGMMIHCGNPIQYGSIETPYWVEHFYMFGRLPSKS